MFLRSISKQVVLDLKSLSEDLAVCGRTVFFDYFICVAIDISLGHFLSPFSFLAGAPITRGFNSYCFNFSRQILVYVLSIQINLHQPCNHMGMQSLLSGSYFFYSALKWHMVMVSLDREISYKFTFFVLHQCLSLVLIPLIFL